MPYFKFLFFLTTSSPLILGKAFGLDFKFFKEAIPGVWEMGMRLIYGVMYGFLVTTLLRYFSAIPCT
jgi:hypothetical protein